MVLFAAQVGFLHSAPKDWGGATRFEYAKSRGHDLDLPTLGESKFLWDLFETVGKSTVSDQGAEIPLDWRALYYFAVSTGSISEPWEFRLLIDMSTEYCRFKREGEDVFCTSPMERKRDKDSGQEFLSEP